MKKISFLCVLALFVQLCVSPLTVNAAPKPSGTITISGAWALYPMVVKWAEEFRKTYPDIRVDISAGGAGKGVADALAEVVDLGMVSRDLQPTEIEKGVWFVAVTKDAVVPTINAANPLLKELLAKGVKRQAFISAWVDESIESWEKLMGRQGSTSLHVYTRSDSCGAAETWALYFGKKQEDLQGVGVYGDPGLAEAVKNDQLGLGFNNINYAYDAQSKRPIQGICILPIDLNGNGTIDKAESVYTTRDDITKAIADGVYPSPPARDLYLAAKGQPRKELVRLFISWILSEGQKFVSEAGYISLSSEKLADGLKKLGK